MDETRDNARIQAILASGIKIPPLPDVLIKVQNLLRDPDVSTQEVARLINQDGALSGAIFRVVGSPVFGLRTKVETLERAVALLGIPPTLGILRGLALRHAFSDAASQAALESLWQRSGHIAQLTVALAKRLRKAGVSAEQAYTLGMFHDCGLALLIKRFPAYAEALKQPVWPDITALDQAHDTDHGLLGQQVAKNWQLPEDITLAIRQHHAPIKPATDIATRMNALLSIAIYLHAQHTGQSVVDWENSSKPAALQALNLSAEDWQEAEMEIREEMSELAA